MNMEAINGNLDIDENRAIDITNCCWREKQQMPVILVRKFFKSCVIQESQG